MLSEGCCKSRQEVTKPLFGIDIGGTLTKCVYFEPYRCDVDLGDVSFVCCSDC